MKKYNIILAAAFITVLFSCTKDFEKNNMNPNAASDSDLKRDYLDVGGFLLQMQQKIVPIVNNGTDDVNTFQVIYNLCGDNFSGQQGPSNQFGNNNLNNNTYQLTPGWYGANFENAYLNIMSPWAVIKERSREKSPTTFAVASILKVMGMQQTTDAYGPIPYTKFSRGALAVEYDSQELVYDTFFDEIDTATAILKRYVAQFPGVKPLQKVDRIYKGDFEKWIKLANSLKLRMAMRIRFVSPVKAKVKAEEAVSAGLITQNTENAVYEVDGISTWNTLFQTTYLYNDTRMGATMESFIRGYNDPRGTLLFNKVALPASTAPDFHGIRTGVNIDATTYRGFSAMNITANTAVPFFTAAEAYFLRAEGALIGWTMDGSAQEFYETGVRRSFSQNIGGSNQAAGDASNYLNSTSKPAAYVDPINQANNIPLGDANLSTITVKWDAGAALNVNLERIITQKWIALFPQGLEAWAEFRRTGYPKVFPVQVNNSGGTISTTEQIKRLPFTVNEYSRNNAAVLKAVALLNGPDNGGTALWWDK
ncbi:MAG: Susd and RagB outer rane lipoprotein [Sphingobacterium sp.]|jgi:hypothetical protein|nr:Susd and RagB outer rane lipoprotein [Sphingobacterium sp.]